MSRDRIRHDRASGGQLAAPIDLNADETRELKAALARKDYAAANTIVERARMRQRHDVAPTPRATGFEAERRAMRAYADRLSNRWRMK